MQNIIFVFGGLSVLLGMVYSTWVIFYKVKPEGIINKLFSFLVTGALVAFLAFAVSVTIIWPPVM